MQGILFIEPLYNQMKAGRKNQTRRTGGLDQINEDPNEWSLQSAVFIGPKDKQSVVFRNFKSGVNQMCKARYAIGEKLFLKEPTAKIGNQTVYKYDGAFAEQPKWANKLYMGEKSAREFIQITKVSIDRLLNISDEDCLAEGIEVFNLGNKVTYKDYMGKTKFSSVETPKESFLSLYTLANKASKVPKPENPWCWKYEFIRVTH